MHQRAKVTKLMRYFVRGCGEPSHQPNTRADGKRRAHSQSTDELVQPITEQHQNRERVVMMTVGVVLSMMPMQQLLESKEARKADSGPAVCRVGVHAFGSRWQHV